MKAWNEMDVQIIIGNKRRETKIPGLCYYTFGDPNELHVESVSEGRITVN